MLIVTLSVNNKPVGTLTARRLDDAREGPDNDYEVRWKPGAAEVGSVQRAWVRNFDRTRRALALIAEAVKALGLE